ncbi:MAG TPA: leucine-rich repeat-containing protein kinase family protein [Leptolyngbyaceae cyanobacterium]
MAMKDLIQSGYDAATKRLNLACGLTQFPLELLELADSLEILDLSNNQLSSLPHEFSQLRRLKVVFLSNNQFRAVPEVLSQCPNLSMIGFKANQIKHLPEHALPPQVRWLILTDNRLEKLPATIGNQSRLQKLMLAGNQLQTLPDEMANCRNLELIRLSANQLKELPTWLFDLPRLSWLAYAGNPFCVSKTLVEPSLPDIDWTDLVLQETLGQGASGVISRGLWQTAPNQQQTVAVKIFKGEITSDGLPRDEMQACIAAGSHKNLVSVLGKITHHPEGKTGLVFSLVPSEYKVLGTTPSLESCTRDVYDPSTSFSWANVLQIAQGMAAVTTHLHGRGILHGDLYAHNILVNEAGESLLGDFGAASFYDPNDSAVGQALERMEVRAFGCLLEDLLEHCSLKDQSAAAEPGQKAAFDRLRDLQVACMHPNLALRPRFPEICATLTDLSETSLSEGSAYSFHKSQSAI